MAVWQERLFCRHCKRYTLHERYYFGFGMGCLLTLITGFVFLPVWLFMGVLDAFRRWRCQTCGARYRWVPWWRRKERSPEVTIVTLMVVVRWLRS